MLPADVWQACDLRGVFAALVKLSCFSSCTLLRLKIMLIISRPQTAEKKTGLPRNPSERF